MRDSAGAESLKRLIVTGLCRYKRLDFYLVEWEDYVHKQAPNNDNIAPLQRSLVVLSALLIPVLGAAFIMLYLFPQSLGAERFAWSINPLMSSMMLGATYLGGVYFFGAALYSRQWRHVRLGLLPVTAFAATLGIATLLHWQAFAHERLGFQLWLFLYVCVPLILPVLWYRNRQEAGPGNFEGEGDLPQISRWAFGALGLIMTIASLLLFFLPEQMMSTWPWTLSPLTSRVMAAMFILPGLVGLSLAYDGGWSGARYLLTAMAIPIVLMLIAAYVARANFDWSNPASWLFVGALVLILLLVGYSYLAKS